MPDDPTMQPPPTDSAARLQPALPTGGKRLFSPSFVIIIIIIIVIITIILKADLKFRRGADKEIPLKSSSGFILR